MLELTCRKQSRRKLVYDLSEREEYEGAMIAFYKRFGVIAGEQLFLVLFHSCAFIFILD